MSEKSKKEDVNNRLAAMLKGAFAGPPTPLKAIPKKAKSPKPTKARIKRHQGR